METYLGNGYENPWVWVSIWDTDQAWDLIHEVSNVTLNDDLSLKLYII